MSAAKNGGRRVRLVDVARYAGVSTKTVSNVVHNYEHVTADMRSRVQKAIKDLGYKPNLTARRLVTGKTSMIALAIPETNHPYFSSLADAIVKAAEDRDYRVLIEQTDGDSEKELDVLRDREAGLVDGVIFQPAKVTSLELADIEEDTPVVILGEAASPIAFDHIMIDNTQAAEDAVRHLIGLGRKRIAFLGDVRGDNAGATKKRLAGYQAAIEEAGMNIDTTLVLPVESFGPESAKVAVQEAVKSGLIFDAVLCRDDRFAVAALQALRDYEIEVPSDVAVIGWDDTSLARYSYPTLTSVSPNIQSIAEEAVSMLIERIEGLSASGRHKLAPYSLHIRESAPALKLV